MEALADFGTVNLLGFRTLPDAIYRLWYGAFDRQAALQVGAVLLGLVAVLLMIERSTRRRSVQQSAGDARSTMRRELRSWRAGVAFGLPVAFLAIVFVGPLVQLSAWALDSIQDSTYDPDIWRNACATASCSRSAHRSDHCRHRSRGDLRRAPVGNSWPTCRFASGNSRLRRAGLGRRGLGIPHR